MLRLKHSVAKTALVSLVGVTTLVLSAFGAVDYYRERTQLLDELNAGLKESTAQLSASLSNSLWNMDIAHVGKILESAMLNSRIYAVVVRDADFNNVVAARIRDRNWRIVVADQGVSGTGLLSETRDIYFENKAIGLVEVYATTIFMERSLQRSLINIAIRIFVLNVILAGILAVILRRKVFSPLRAVEGYALAVSAGREGASLIRDVRFHGEIENLRGAIETMVSQLTAAEKKYRDIFENATEGIFQIAASGRYIAANPAMARMLGYGSPEEMMRVVTRAPDQIFFDSGDRDAWLERLAAEGWCAGFKTRFARRDNQTIWVVINARAVRSENGDIAYIEGATVDITARERAERRLEILNRHLKRAVQDRTKRLAEKARELEEANVRLKELDELKSSFLSTVSHDLRTPLTSVLGFAKLINRDFARSFLPLAAVDEGLEKKGRRIVENLSIIENEGERLTRLINDFLDLSKIESGRAEWRDQELDVAGLVEQAVRAVSGDLAVKPEVALNVFLDDDLPRLHADPDRMAQVLVNLLNNAVKFTDAGRIEVRARAVAPERLRLEVADAGPGIAPEFLEKIFDKFLQVGRTNSADAQRPKGTGLGLAICKNIIEHYRGSIRAESTLGKGSVFIIELPAAGSF